MNFEWDENKRIKNISERGIDFIDIIPLFQKSDSIVIDDLRKNYGEPRHILFGYINNKLYQVCFTTRNDNIRIISARRANNRERKRYEEFKKNYRGFDG